MTPRTSPTAAAAAALAAAMAQARGRLRHADAAATRSAARIAELRSSAQTVVGGTASRLGERTRATAALLAAVERRRRRTAALFRWRTRAVQGRLLLRHAMLTWYRTSRLLTFALVAAACLWWGLRVSPHIAGFVAALLHRLTAAP